MKFNELGLTAPLLKALVDEGYTTPTPIQAQAIPTILSAPTCSAASARWVASCAPHLFTAVGRSSLEQI